MIADVDEDRRVQGATLALAALATASAELAIAEPGRPPGVSLAWAAAWFLIALMVHYWTRGFSAEGEAAQRHHPGAGRRGRRSSTRPLIIVAMLVVFALPFAIEAGRLAWSGRAESLEIVLLAALRNLGLGLAVLASRPAFARLAALVSLFLVLVSSSLAEGTTALGTLGLYAAVGGTWLVLTYWRGLRLPAAPEGRRRFPLATLLLAVGLVGGAVAVAAVGPTRAATALAGLMPSSGGTSWDNPDARGGVNDGENEARGSEKPESIGFTDTDIYLDSDRPSLYDAFNDMYGEPFKPRHRDRMIALSNQNVQEQRDRPAENLRAGRQFSAVRRGSDRPTRRPSDREAKALLYVKGPTPLHLGLAAYDRFDGREWEEEPTCAMDCPLVLEFDRGPWFRLDSPVPPLYAGSVAHQIKIGTLDSSPLPVPPHLSRFRIGQVNRRDFFDWSHEGMVRMVGRTVPSGTVIESETRTPDPGRLRDLSLPPGSYAAPRFQRIADGRGIAPEVASLARAWSDEVPRGWGQVEAIVAALRRHAAHDQRIASPPECDDVVADFLLRSRRGPDYLFATSAAMLLRSLDYPTRLVSGFYVAPDRYDPRTRHTPVTREDVHVWAEVRLPNGTWVAVEPTPGYELMGPSLPWSERVRAAIASAWRWARSHAAWLGLAAAGLAALARFRRDVADALATLAWRARPSADPRHFAIEALRLVERRSSWAGRPRPSGWTPRRWYETMTPKASGEADDLQGLILLAEWSLYAPLHAAPPKSCGDDDPLAACRRAVSAWSLHRFRSLDPAPHPEGTGGMKTIPHAKHDERNGPAVQAIEAIRASLNAALRGKGTVVEHVLACLLARGHLLVEDLPGLGKTTLAKALARAIGGKFARVQCTPDLLPGDITGFRVFDPLTREFEFLPGPVFADVLLCDEINRASPRTQSALLEAMAERQVTIDNVRHVLSDTFFVIATQNPVEQHGTYPLPEAQLDRFAMKLRIGYPARDDERAMLDAAVGATSDAPGGFALSMGPGQLRALQEAVAAVAVGPLVRDYLVDLGGASRSHRQVTLGLSPRGLLTWQRLRPRREALPAPGRGYATPDDVQAMAGPVLEVRLGIEPEATARVLAEILDAVPVPVGSGSRTS